MKVAALELKLMTGRPMNHRLLNWQFAPVPMLRTTPDVLLVWKHTDLVSSMTAPDNAGMVYRRRRPDAGEGERGGAERGELRFWSADASLT